MDAIHNTHVIHVPNGWTARNIFAVFSFHTEKLSILLGISAKKKCKCSLYPLKSNEDRAWVARTRSQTSKKKNKSKKSRAAADFGLDILTQMPIKQIKWDSKCVW